MKIGGVEVLGYHVLAMGISDDLLLYLQTVFSPFGFRFSDVSSAYEAGRLLRQETFHLLIVDLDYLREIQQDNWLAGIRRISFVPVIVLSSTSESDFSNIVRLGADICIPNQLPHTTIEEIAMSQIRRYVAYNRYCESCHAETTPFQVGDIAVDPARRQVWVRGQLVTLLPREFSLLLYFMRNPDIVLTQEQICEHAWKKDYVQDIAPAIHNLRQQIEDNPASPVYIKTVHRAGYRFTGHFSETCDK